MSFPYAGGWRRYDTRRRKREDYVFTTGHDDLIVGYLLVFTTSSLKGKMMFVVTVSVNQDSAGNLPWKLVIWVCQIRDHTYVVLFNPNNIILIHG